MPLPAFPPQAPAARENPGTPASGVAYIKGERGCVSAPSEKNTRGADATPLTCVTRGADATPLACALSLNTQYPVARRDLPGSDDLSVLNHIRLTMQRHRWANVCGNGEDFVTGTMALGDGRWIELFSYWEDPFLTQRGTNFNELRSIHRQYG